jgi:hypothetical protein
MGKILFIYLLVHTTIYLSGQANGGWGNCEFTTVAAMEAFDPGSSISSCKKVFVQSTKEHYHWTGSSWILESEDVYNIYTVDETLLEDRTIDMGSFNLNFINGDTFVLDVNFEIRTGNIRLSEFGSGNKTGTETYSLGVDSDGDLIEIPLGSGSGDNIYNSNGTLTGNRIVNGNSNNLSITGLNNLSLSAISTTIGSTANIIYESDQNDNGTGDHKFFTGTTEQMKIENSGTIDLLQYGGGFLEDNDNNTYDLAVDGSGNVIEVDRRVRKINTTTYSYGSNQHNLTLSNLSSSPYYEVYRINPTSGINLTGIDATGVKDGQIVTLLNISTSNRFTVMHQDINSISTNRLIISNDTDMRIRKGESITFIYDATSARWRVYAFGRS